MLPATIAICRKLCSLQAKQKHCSDLNCGDNRLRIFRNTKVRYI